MNYKNSIPLILTLIFFTQISAQNSKDYRDILGVAAFTATLDSEARFATTVQQRFVDVLTNVNLFKLVDLDGTARNMAIEKAQENYKAENWLDAHSALSAEYTLAGNIGAIKFIRLNAGKGYKAAITVTTSIIHTESGRIMPNGTSTFSSSESPIKLTPESALQAALATMVPMIENFLRENFLIKVGIARIEELKKQKAQKILLEGGTNFGLEEKQAYKVVFIDHSLGKPLPVEIGKIKVDEVLSEDFALAKVTKGGEEIFRRFSSGEEIICEQIK